MSADLHALRDERAGCVRLWRPRGAGVVVGVYRAAEAGLDDDEGRTPWSLVCEDHGTVMAFATRALAEYHGVIPSGWCEICSGAQNEDHTYKKGP